MELPLEMYQTIRSFLPGKEAHRFREVRKDLVNFHPLELKARYNVSNAALIKLASIGDLIGIKYLISNGVELHGDALFIAAKYNKWNIVKYLINQGININSISGSFAFKEAIKHDYLDIVKDFVEHGINPEIIGDGLNIAIRNGSLDMVKYFVEHGLNSKIIDVGLDQAVWAGRWKIVKYLIEHGADIHINNDIALRNAAKFGLLGAVKGLVRLGADVNANNDEAFFSAIKGGYTDVAQFLADQGLNLDPDVVEYILKPGDYTLCKAIVAHKFNLIEYMLQHHAYTPDEYMQALETARCEGLSNVANLLRGYLWKMKSRYRTR